MTQDSSQKNLKTGSKLLFVTVLNFSITLVQIVGGLLSNSLSLLSDALHNLGDAMALFIAFVANKLSSKSASLNKTFGYKRIEVLAALLNSLVLIVISFYLFVEAYNRFVNPEPIKGVMMLVVACFGLLANFISVVVMHNFRDTNLNIRAAYLHLIGDTISSIAVIFGGVFIWLYDIFWIDPVVTFLLGIYICYEAYKVVQETIQILMHFTPKEVDLIRIKEFIESHDFVDNIHHVHCWKLTDVRVQFEAHIELSSKCSFKRTTNFTHVIEKYLLDNFGITHVTIQYECGSKDDHTLVNEEMKVINQ